eukprot:4869458-Prymnesium_polylepis.1
MSAFCSAMTAASASTPQCGAQASSASGLSGKASTRPLGDSCAFETALRVNVSDTPPGSADEEAVEPFNSKESHNLLRAARPSARGYARLYRPSNCPSRCFIEATPYFGIGSTHAQLHGLFPAAHRHSARFVVVLRDPIARDISWYRYAMAMPLIASAYAS